MIKVATPPTPSVIVMSQSDTTVPCSSETKRDVLEPLKRGGETYDELLRKMAREYEPETPEVNV